MKELKKSEMFAVRVFIKHLNRKIITDARKVSFHMLHGINRVRGQLDIVFQEQSGELKAAEIKTSILSTEQYYTVRKMFEKGMKPEIVQVVDDTIIIYQVTHVIQDTELYKEVNEKAAEKRYVLTVRDHNHDLHVDVPKRMTNELGLFSCDDVLFEIIIYNGQKVIIMKDARERCGEFQQRVDS